MSTALVVAVVTIASTMHTAKAQSAGTEPICTNTCALANNGYCNDGGPESSPPWWCDLGSDCADCGIRCQPGREPDHSGACVSIAVAQARTTTNRVLYSDTATCENPGPEIVGHTNSFWTSTGVDGCKDDDQHRMVVCDDDMWIQIQFKDDENCADFSEEVVFLMALKLVDGTACIERPLGIGTYRYTCAEGETIPDYIRYHYPGGLPYPKSTLNPKEGIMLERFDGAGCSKGGQPGEPYYLFPEGLPHNILGVGREHCIKEGPHRSIRYECNADKIATITFGESSTCDTSTTIESVEFESQPACLPERALDPEDPSSPSRYIEWTCSSGNEIPSDILAYEEEEEPTWTPTLTSCPSKDQHKCYLYVPKQFSHSSAEDNCQRLAAFHLSEDTPTTFTIPTLATAENEQEFTRLIEALVAQVPKGSSTEPSYAWIGGTDSGTRNTNDDRIWQWGADPNRHIAESVLKLEPWATGEPNNWKKNEKCINVLTPLDESLWGSKWEDGTAIGKWNDGNCNQQYHSVCELNICGTKAMSAAEEIKCPYPLTYGHPSTDGSKYTPSRQCLHRCEKGFGIGQNQQDGTMCWDLCWEIFESCPAATGQPVVDDTCSTMCSSITGASDREKTICKTRCRKSLQLELESVCESRWSSSHVDEALSSSSATNSKGRAVQWASIAIPLLVVMMLSALFVAAALTMYRRRKSHAQEGAECDTALVELNDDDL